jgi:hypothetical protein
MELYEKLWPTQDRKAIELWCFANDPPEGLGRYQHCKNAIDDMWNRFYGSAVKPFSFHTIGADSQRDEFHSAVSSLIDRSIFCSLSALR